MSLINQVLRDLERREPIVHSAAPNIPDVMPTTEAINAAPNAMSWPMPLSVSERSPRKWLLAQLGLSALMLVGGAAWWMNRASVPHKVVSPVTRPESKLPAAATPRIIADTDPAPDAEASGRPNPVRTLEPSSTPPAKPDQAANAATSKQIIKAVTVPVKSGPVPRITEPVTTSATTTKTASTTSTQASAAPRAEQLFQQAQTELKQDQIESALNSLRASLEADPRHVQARLNLARLLAERKQVAAAADLLVDGVMLLPQQNAFVLALAPLWFQSGQQDDALALLAQSAKQPSATPQLTSYYAAQLLRLKRHNEAASQFRIALRSDPAQPDWLIGLGLSLQGSGQYREAVDALRRAYETGKLNAERKDLVEQMIVGLKARY